MPRRTNASLVYIGIKAHVIAFDRKTGVEAWRTPLPAKYKSAADFVNVLRDSEGLFATCAGEVFALDPRTGTVIWKDELRKLGTGLVTLATDLGATPQTAALGHARAAQQAAASTAATTAAI
jgi:outer membrane protein assembly factor BamB